MSAMHILSGGLPQGTGRRLLAAFSSLATPLVALMVYLNPTGEPNASLSFARSWPSILLVWAFEAFILWRMATTRRRGEYLILQVLGLLFCICIYILGSLVHRGIARDTRRRKSIINCVCD